MRALDLRQSNRFARSYRRASPPLQGLIEHAIHDFQNRYKASPTTIGGQYDHLAGIPGPILKLDVTGGHRLLALWKPPQLTLLDVGEHSILEKYTAKKLLQDISKRSELPPQFASPSQTSFFLRAPDQHFAVYGNELTSDWLYFLSDQQLDAVDGVLDQFIESLEGSPRTVFVIGGPGTGKTSVLLNLVKWFADLGVTPRLEISDELAEYVSASTAADIEVYRSEEEPEVLLVDDPGAKYEIRNAARQVHGERLTVVAFDPCQLYDALADSEFEKLVLATKADVVRLNTCYRQKANVGAATKHAAELIALSTPYLRKDRQQEYSGRYRELTEFANGLEFPNPHGYVQVYDAPSSKDLAAELARIRRKPMWKHWPSILAVIDESVTVPTTWTAMLEEVGARQLGLAEIGRIKGLEYQHVLLIVNELLYRQVNTGFEGSGRAEYLHRRLLRIPFSRAKDSLVTFVAAAVPDGD